MTNRFEFDPTAMNPSNKVVDELHLITTDDSRIFLLAEGRFYTLGMAVVHGVTGELLVPTEDYWVVDMDLEITMATGFETGYAVVVKPGIASVKVTYQVVGADQLIDTGRTTLIEYLRSKDYNHVYWRQILGRPETFPPALHSHSLADLNDWSVVVDRLDRIIAALGGQSQGPSGTQGPQT